MQDQSPSIAPIKESKNTELLNKLVECPDCGKKYQNPHLFVLIAAIFLCTIL